MSEKEQQFERIYKETENFGRTQFVREIQMQINDNKKKDKEIERLNNIINKAIKKCDENADWIEEVEGAYSGAFIEIEDILKGSGEE